MIIVCNLKIRIAECKYGLVKKYGFFKTIFHGLNFYFAPKKYYRLGLYILELHSFQILKKYLSLHYLNNIIYFMKSFFS